MAFRWLILFLVLAIIELYAYQAVKTIVKTKPVLVSYQIISALILICIIYSFTQFDRKIGQTSQSMQTMGLLLIVYIPKIILTLFLLGEDIFRLGYGALNHFVRFSDSDDFLPSRRKFVSQIGLGLAAVPFFSLIYGITTGKYNYKVIKQAIFFPDLPDAFDGMTITHISDIHSGSFDNPEKINYAIDLINEQNSDLILFTGDIVNTHAKEMHPWIDTFKRIKNHKYGKFSILGNHDYGEYVTWSTQDEKEKNFQEIKDLHQQIDFKLMLNENTFIENGTDKIALVGVENWGVNFKKAGDLQKASNGLSQEHFKILMSHDPSHWDAEVNKHDKNFHLTLSGHTHGMQFGIEIPGILKWSPIQYLYKQWAGLYENAGRYVYVNRGFGFHAYAGRVGIMPEITVIQLKKAKNIV
jgi:predicted MPP superfamily phosphohydrolase